MIRIFDIVFAFFGLLIFTPLMVLIFLIGYLDNGSPIFIQKRLGRHEVPFKLFKFRSMHISTISKATHLVDPKSVTRFGKLLRKTKMDEIPQLWNVLIGDMSFVGPRPCLLNQSQLIEERRKRNLFDIRPGITGLAQTSGVDMSDPVTLSLFDHNMVKSLNLKSYLMFILKTILGKGFGDRVKN